jgi:hypothetical protein
MNKLSLFRFTIRDALWLTVVVALCVVWFMEHFATQQRTAKLDAESASLDKERAAIKSERANYVRTLQKVHDDARADGYRHGVKDGRANARVIRVPPSQKEAEPGVWFLGPGELP